ncbi:MAG: GGDEF domain-containing protein [Clostridia bacterium]|nr:GGDEF domain-containing protein [Clostridia bacterium]
MKKFWKISEKGIRLRVVNYVMLAVTLVISALLLISNYTSTESYNKLHSIASDYISWHESADDIQRASDYLTEQVRVFAITGNKKYHDNYFNESDEVKRREKALENIENKVFGAESYKELEDAINESFSLMDIEFRSMRLMAEALIEEGATYEGAPLTLENFHEKVRAAELTAEDKSYTTAEEKKIRARYLVFSEEYERQKEIISAHVRECLDKMDGDYVAKQLNAADELSFMFHYEQFLVVAHIFIVLTIIALVSFNVLIPLIKAIPYLKNEQKVPVKGAYEYRYLAETYNKMFDINQRNKEELIREATHDALTGVYNRREFKQLLDQNELTVSALILFDIDHFKQINDQFGHLVGDKVLTFVSQKIEEAFGGVGYTCRIGGDEVAVIITDMSLSQEEIFNKASSINTTLEKERGDLPETYVSSGIAYFEDDMRPASLFKHADRALYITKRNGRKGCTVYSDPNEDR